MNPVCQFPDNARRTGSTVLAICVVVQLAASGELFADDRIKLGRDLFMHKWTAHDELSPKGDGLGPMFNADSCVACHFLGDAGGAGPAENDVELLSIAAPDKNASRRQFMARQSNASSVHSGFSSQAASIVFHQFSTTPEYERWRYSILGFKPPAELSPTRKAAFLRAVQRKQLNQSPVVELRRKNGAQFQLSRRNTTPLFGAGLIDALPEETLLELADQQPRLHPGISGRVGRTATGKVGRFGWRGQVATLQDFVLTACAVELGLQNKDHPQGIDPLHRDIISRGNDLSQEQCDALVAFVAALPAPRRLPVPDQRLTIAVRHGEGLFESIGCAACHVRDVGNVKGLFSDLLLHDMGSALEDPLPAIPERIKTGVTMDTWSYGGSALRESLADLPTNIRREWKTPPLWGVRDSAPYLHDGRAQTLEEAIVAHGGEAASSAARFSDLDPTARSHVLSFLSSLAAPREPGRIPPLSTPRSPGG